MPLLFEYPWIPDQQDGTFRNPILCADYPDPDVIRDGDDFYMVVSSFHVAPGLPILHSRDLVNWTLINHALPRLPHERYDAVHPGCGIWAPAIRKHAGKFWIFFPTPDEGIYCITANHPAGTWSPPHLVQAGRGLIDPCPLWDDDGKAYLVHAYAQSRCGIKHKLHVRPMAPDGSRLLGEGQIVYDDPVNHPTLEGPKFLKRDCYYYILAPAGGVENGWQLALRSSHIYGPYEAKIILEQGATSINGPHQGALVDTPDGEWWFVHFQDARVYGRVAHLQPAHWVDGWPLLGVDQDGNGVGEPVLQSRMPRMASSGNRTRAEKHVLETPTHLEPQTSDDFDAPALGLQWHWNANPRPHSHDLSARPGWLRLFTTAGTDRDLSRCPGLLLQKFPAMTFVAEALIDFHSASPDESAGLIISGRHHAALRLRNNSSSPASPDRILEYLIDGTVVNTATVPAGPVRLLVHVATGGLCTFGHRLSDAPACWMAHPFQATAGVWVGAKIGLFAIRQPSASADAPTPDTGHADIDYLRFYPPSHQVP